MLSKLNVPVIFITLLILTIITLTGCDPFTYPTGIWYCEDLQITVNFQLELLDSKGSIIINGQNEDILIRIGNASGGAVDIFFPREDNVYVFGEYELYSGYFKWKNKNTMIFNEINIKTREYTGNKYVFVKLSDETSVKD